ncbi:MAG: bifunctional pyr operon transcriptional regulator/uracil phosphoribosyltransferase PyrR [Elusimicrobia bacterium]|nr:bifunctional pyr operon transcriptional regulator/uracil phosphoribosyltransferase PyrR [Elusimicrobiota bacterium]
MTNLYKTKKVIMNKNEIAITVKRLAGEIIERNHGAKDLVIIGIRTRGVFLAERLAAEIKKVSPKVIPLGILDITLYRDDFTSLSEMPLVKETRIPFHIEDKNIILVDDVLFTGRTIRAALDEIIDFGRPKSIQLAILVDRGHRELPIQADFVGKIFKTAKAEMISVNFKEIDQQDQVTLNEQVSV